MIKSKELALIFVMVFLPSALQASNGYPGYIFTSSFSFLSSSTESSERADFKDSDTFIDIKMGYGFRSGLYLGGLYSGFTDSDEDRKGFGPSVGYHNSGFFIGASYLISVTHEISTEFQTLKGGSGYTIEAGYNYPLLSFLSVGANLTYINLTYKESESYAGATTSIATHKESFFYPMLQISFFYGRTRGARPAFNGFFPK